MKNYIILLTIICLFFSLRSYSQLAITVPRNGYGLQVIDNKGLFFQTVSADSNKAMISIRSTIPSVVLDLRYATTNNFMKRRMYPPKTNDTYMRLPAARALLKVQNE